MCIRDSNDGELDKAEFVAACGEGPLGMDQKAAARMFSMADTNGDGVLDRGEFTAAYLTYKEGSDMFRVIDSNGDGEIDKVEFYESCKSNVLAISQHDAETFFARADLNGDGVLDKWEFITAYSVVRDAAASESVSYTHLTLPTILLV